MSAVRLRIVSDLHVGEPHSRLQSVDQLAPLLADVGHLVFNGDTLDTRFLDLDPDARAHQAAFTAFLAAHPGRITLITGNHDPDQSAVHHLDLEDGRVLVTHGDVLFPEMAPWGWEAAHFRTEQERLLAAVPAAERETLDTRLRVCKTAIHNIRHLSPHRPDGRGHRWRRNFRVVRALLRLHRIWNCWRDMPDAAARFAAAYRPAARIVILGHFHWPGVWRRRGRTIINTGAATLAHGALAVDFVGRQLQVRPLGFRRGGIRIGAVRHTVDLDATLDRLPPAPASSSAPPHER